MKFFKRSSTTENSTAADIQKAILGFFNWLGYGAPKITEKLVLKLSTVYRCASLISDSIAKLEFAPYNIVGDFLEKDQNNNLYNLLNIQPNNLQGAFMFKKNIVLYLLMRGEAFVRVHRTRSNKIIKLKLLNSDLMKVEVNTDIDEMLYTYNGSWVDASDIIHIINYPDDYGRGRSVISFAADTLGMGLEIQQHSRTIFQKQGKVFGLLSPKSSDVRIKDEVKLKQKFVQNIGDETGVIVLDADLDFKPLQLTPKDAQIIENKSLNVSDVCRFFGVPLILVYDNTVSSNYNSSEQTILEFINNTLHPLMEKIENEFFRKLFLPSEWVLKDLLFNNDDLYRLDYKTLAEYYTKMFGIAAVMPNEVRAKLRLKPITGGNRAFVNTNVQPLDNLIYDQKFKKQPIDNNAK